MLPVPERLAAAHGGERLAEMGKKWSETFTLWGGLTADDRVLDIGCGPGRMANAIGERFEWKTPQYVGFDITKRDIEFAKDAISKDHPQFEFHCVNARNDLYRPTGFGKIESIKFPSRSNSASFCLATSIFTHFYRSETEHYFAEAYRCLGPGGRFFSTWFLLDGAVTTNPRFTFSIDNGDGTRSETQASRREAMAFSYNDVMDMLKRTGFENIQYHRGAWRRDDREARHAQDTIVAVRP